METLLSKFIESAAILGINENSVEYAIKESNYICTEIKIDNNIKNFLNIIEDYLTQKAIEKSNLSINSFSKKIETLIWNKLMVYSEFRNYREFLKQKIKFSMKHPAFAAKQIYTLSNQLWYAAGDKATDFSFYTKRITLSALYKVTMVKFTGDYSCQFCETKLFLRNRISNIVSFTQFKNRIKNFN